MAKLILTGGNQLKTKVKALSPTGKVRATVKVVYSAPYAVKQHEDLTLNHPNGGQAKYLEQPARTERDAMAAAAREKLRQKKGVEAAAVAAAGVLLEKSQELVPVDTGFLRDSGHLELEGA